MPENGKEYSMEIVEHAEDLYCVDGHTFDQVAAITGVSVPTLKRWSAGYTWQEKRDNIRRARSAIRTNRIMLHSKLIEKCLTSLNPMDAFAVSSIEGVVQRAAQMAAKGQVGDTQREVLRKIETEADAVAALDEAIEIKINRLLANPDGLSFSAMKDIRSAMDLLKTMRTKVGPPSTAVTSAIESAPEKERKGSGLSTDAVDRIRRDILGIK